MPGSNEQNLVRWRRYRYENCIKILMNEKYIIYIIYNIYKIKNIPP
jgi:hypothetical protein